MTCSQPGANKHSQRLPGFRVYSLGKSVQLKPSAPKGWWTMQMHPSFQTIAASGDEMYHGRRNLQLSLHQAQLFDSTSVQHVRSAAAARCCWSHLISRGLPLLRCQQTNVNLLLPRSVVMFSLHGDHMPETPVIKCRKVLWVRCTATLCRLNTPMTPCVTRRTADAHIIGQC